MSHVVFESQPILNGFQSAKFHSLLRKLTKFYFISHWKYMKCILLIFEIVTLKGAISKSGMQTIAIYVKLYRYLICNKLIYLRQNF